MTKANKIIYWISTVWLALGMFSSGIVQLFDSRAAADSIAHLGYPVYFLKILGGWKIMGAAALLVPKLPLLKEWAYAGFFFAMSGAAVSHIAAGAAATELLPALLLLILTVVSYGFRPADRKIIAVSQYANRKTVSVNQ